MARNGKCVVTAGRESSGHSADAEIPGNLATAQPTWGGGGHPAWGRSHLMAVRRVGWSAVVSLQQASNLCEEKQVMHVDEYAVVPLAPLPAKRGCVGWNRGHHHHGWMPSSRIDSASRGHGHAGAHGREQCLPPSTQTAPLPCCATSQLAGWLQGCPWRQPRSHPAADSRTAAPRSMTSQKRDHGRLRGPPTVVPRVALAGLCVPSSSSVAPGYWTSRRDSTTTVRGAWAESWGQRLKPKLGPWFAAVRQSLHKVEGGEGPAAQKLRSRPGKVRT